MILLELFLSFLQIGAFSFGGGYAAMPLIQAQVVTKYHWLSMAEFTDLITISQMTPGPIAVNSGHLRRYQDRRYTGSANSDPGVHPALLYHRDADCFTLSEIPESVPAAGNPGVASACGSGHDCIGGDLDSDYSVLG